MRDLIDNRAGALYLTSFFFGHRTFTPGHVILPGFTCGQVIFPECPPSVDLSAQNRLQCGHFMLPAPAILWVKLHIPLDQRGDLFSDLTHLYALSGSVTLRFPCEMRRSQTAF